MRIRNIPHDRENSTLYELEIIGKKEEIEKYVEWTKYDSDFIEEENDNKLSITILGDAETKKEFRKLITKDLKEFRKFLRENPIKENKTFKLLRFGHFCK